MHLMEESFLLKFYGRYNIFEQSIMTAEERSWVLDRIDKENKKAAEKK